MIDATRRGVILTVGCACAINALAISITDLIAQGAVISTCSAVPIIIEFTVVAPSDTSGAAVRDSARAHPPNTARWSSSRHATGAAASDLTSASSSSSIAARQSDAASVTDTGRARTSTMAAMASCRALSTG